MHSSTIPPPIRRRRGVAAADAAPLLDALRKQAAGLVGSIYGSKLITLLNTLGNFPYYWQDDNHLNFNIKTYDWISHNILAGSDPLALDDGSRFIDLYRQVIGDIVYSLSSADQAALNQAAINAAEQQGALLNNWSSIFGSIPPGDPTKGLAPIDQVMNIIATTWASPATNLSTIQSTPDLRRLLNETPASGMPLLPLLANYLNALGSSVALENAVSLNSGYITSLIDAIDTPSQANGAMPTNDATQPLVPAWNITPLATIVNGLQNTQSAINVSMSVERTSKKDVTVNISGQASFSIPVGDFLTADVNAQASYFSEHIATTDNTVSISMNFPGVTLVNFSPSVFDVSSLLNWYWTEPVDQAIQFSGTDTSNYKFSPACPIVFGDQGPFGLLNGLAICAFPTIVLVVTSTDYESIASTFDQSVSVNVSLLGIPMASGSESSHTASTSVDSSTSTVTITLTPSPNAMGGAPLDQEAWILGAIPVFPADGNNGNEVPARP